MDLRIEAMHFVRQPNPVKSSGHDDVRQQYVNRWPRLTCQSSQRCISRGDFIDLVTQLLEHSHHRFAHFGVVIDQKNARRVGRRKRCALILLPSAGPMFYAGQ